MQFPDPLIPGRLVRRYKRFLADVEMEAGEVVTAHCPNPGSMLGLDTPGAEVFVSPALNPKRKLRFTLEMIRVGESLVGINTARPNSLAAEAIAAGRIPELAGYGALRREVRYGSNSRVDLLLEDEARPSCYVEVKSVTLKRDAAVPGTAEFPDAVTRRGTKHLRELSAIAAGGGRAVMLFITQREDCERFRLAGDIDPDYEGAFEEAARAGVESLCYACKVTPECIELDRPLPLVV